MTSQGIETGTATTAGRGPQDESPSGAAGAPSLSGPILGAYEGHIPDTIGKPDLLVLGNQMAEALSAAEFAADIGLHEWCADWSTALSAWREATR